MARAAVLGALLVALACCTAAPVHESVLVLLDDLEMEVSHSKFLDSLRARGYDVEIKPTSDKRLQLKQWDEWLFDKLVILGSKKELGGAVDVAQILEFADSGRDVLLAVDSAVSEELRELSQELGVDLDASGNAVVDHFGYDAQRGAEDHATVLASGVTASKAVLNESLPGPVLFRGIGMSVSPESETAFLALWGSPTAYCSKPDAVVTEANLAGKEMGLVALVQLRNNARAAVIGSLDMLSDDFIAASATTRTAESVGALGNAALSEAISRWTFRERGVLKASNVRHHAVGSTEQPDIYRINDDVVFAVDIWELWDGTWRPYEAGDVQVELVMLDPYVRASLQHDGSGTFSTAIKLPDIYGVFKWVLDYHRLGYSYIDIEEQIPIRPYKHNEYERFIVQAYPYYASVISMMVGFFAVGIAFLYTK